MANYRTTQDLKEAVLRRNGELTDGTSDYDDTVIEYLNSIYRAIISGGNEFDVDCGEPWIWAQAESPQVLKLVAPYETGTVTLTNGSTTGAFSTAPSVSVAGWYVKLESVPDYYRITAHTASQTSFTIDQAFIGSTVSDSFKAIKTDYELSTAVTRLVAPMTVYRDSVSVQGSPERGQIFEIDANTMSRLYPRMLIQASVPDKYCIIGLDTDGVMTVRFNAYPLEDCRVEIPYIPIVDDLEDASDSIPLLPLGFRECLAYGASYYLMLDKSDNKADTEAALARAKLQALINHNRKSLSLAGHNFGRLVPRRTARTRQGGY